MKTQISLAALALAAAAVVAAPSHADLTFQGAVGLPLNPTAQIPEVKGVRVQGNYYELAKDSGGSLRAYGVVAAGRVADRLELNGGVTRRDGTRFLSAFDKTGFSIGAKYLFTRESDPQRVRLAAGIGHDTTQFKNTYAYLVGTKSFGRGIDEGKRSITGHLGLRYDKFSEFNIDSSRASIFGGIEVPLGESLTAVGELQSKRAKGGSAPFSVSLRYRQANERFGASVGVAKIGIGDSSRFFAQVGYTFGGGYRAQDDTTPAQ